MGRVYRARQVSLDRVVALKFLSAHLANDPAYMARFRNEAALAAKLNHPGIVQVYAAGETGDRHYLAMEFVEGESLRTRLERQGRLAPPEAVAICLRVAEALEYAWERARIIHRDIKPDNILLTHEGGIKVADLGVAKALRTDGTNITQTGMMLGTPSYMSPEQARAEGDADFRADIYGLGCTLFHALAGRPPFKAPSTPEILVKHIHEPPPDIRTMVPDCPPSITRVLGRMLAKSPDRRHGSYGELVSDLRAITDSRAGTTARRPRRLLIPALLAAGLAAGLLLAHIAAIGRTGRPVNAARQALTAAKRILTGHTAPALAVAPFGAETAGELQRSWARYRDVPMVLTNSIGMTLILMPPGEFLMGSHESPEKLQKRFNAVARLFEREVPQHRVSLVAPWYLGIHEVTVRQFRQFVEATGYRTEVERNGTGAEGADWLDGLDLQDTDALRRAFAGLGLRGKRLARRPDFTWCKPSFPQSDDHPVVDVSWNDARAFCDWLAQKERRAYRLPTEAEWEFAYRAGTTAHFYFEQDSPNPGGPSGNEGDGAMWTASGPDYSEITLLGSLRDGYRFTAPVGQYPQNPFGLHDMIGNVSEWCFDWFGPYDEAPVKDPLGTADGSGRVVRGSSWLGSLRGEARASNRLGQRPDLARWTMGFRIASPFPRNEPSAEPGTP